MANANAMRIEYEPLRSIGFASIGSVYARVGTPFDNPARMICLDNISDENLYISFDGVNDHTIVPAGSGRVFDYCSNKSTQSGLSEQAVGTQVYTKFISGPPTDGGLFVTVIYATEG